MAIEGIGISIDPLKELDAKLMRARELANQGRNALETNDTISVRQNNGLPQLDEVNEQEAAEALAGAMDFLGGSQSGDTFHQLDADRVAALLDL